MLEAIRKRSASILVKLLFVLLILSFAAWGVGDYIQGGSSDTNIAEVGNVKISHADVNSEIQRALLRLQNTLGQQITMEQARNMGIVGSVIGQSIDRTLLRLGADDLGIAISNNLISDDIKKNPIFMDELKRFNRDIFYQFLRNNSLTETGFTQIVRDTMAQMQYVGSLTMGLTVPDAMANSIYRFQQEMRVAESLLISNKDAPDAGEPNDEVLNAFYKENAASYTAPEYRGLTIVTLKVDELAKEIKVSEKQIKESFEQRAEEFFAPERRKLQQIILTDEAEAKKAEAMLSDGKPFVEVAKELANMDEKSIDLGLIAKEELFPELKDAVFALTAGANSTPLKSPIGWHILKVVSIETARQQTLDDVRVKLTQDIAKEMALDGLYELANKLEDSLGGGASLEEAARSLGLPVTRIPSIDGGGRNADGQPVDGLPKGWDYLNIAFSTPEGSESALTEVGNKGYYILRVDSVKAPALKPLDKVRSIVVNDWKADTRNKSSEKTAKILLDRINKGEDLFKVATEMKLKVTTSAPFTRSPNSATGDLPLTVIESLFKLKEGQATMGSAGQGYVVARMKEIRSADPAQGKEDFKKLKSTILQSLQNDLVSQLISALRTRHPVSVNQRAIEQLF